jgi:hypothetical protein
MFQDSGLAASGPVWPMQPVTHFSYLRLKQTKPLPLLVPPRCSSPMATLPCLDEAETKRHSVSFKSPIKRTSPRFLFPRSIFENCHLEGALTATHLPSTPLLLRPYKRHHEHPILPCTILHRSTLLLLAPSNLSTELYHRCSHSTIVGLASPLNGSRRPW